MTVQAQRLDKWLWFARLVKTRSLASRLVAAGKIRVNRSRITKPSTAVRKGDIVTAVVNRRVRVIRIVAPGMRRGPAKEACELFDDLTPAEPAAAPTKWDARTVPAPARESGSGRPTKRDRRKMESWRRRSLETS